MVEKKKSYCGSLSQTLTQICKVQINFLVDTLVSIHALFSGKWFGMANLDFGSNMSGANGNAVDQSNGNISALQRINSYLHNTLDLRNLATLTGRPTPQPNNNSIGRIWSRFWTSSDKNYSALQSLES